MRVGGMLLPTRRVARRISKRMTRRPTREKEVARRNPTSRAPQLAVQGQT